MKKPFNTSFEKELIKGMKKLSLDLDCNVNEILEVAYNLLTQNFNKKQIFEMIQKEKECK